MEFERKLFGRIESQIPRVLRAIELKEVLTVELVDWLAAIAISQAVRIPGSRDFIAEGARSLLHEHEREVLRSQPGIGPEALSKALDDFGRSHIVNRHVIPEADNVAVAGIPYFMKSYLDEIKGANASILVSESRDFVTSNAPIHVFDPAPVPESAELLDDTEITMPLSRRYALIITRRPLPDYSTADGATVAIMNSRTTMSDACTEVYAFPDNATVARVAGDIVHQWGTRSLIASLDADD